MPIWALALTAAGSCGLGGVLGYLYAVSRVDRIVASLSPLELETLDRRVRARRLLSKGVEKVP